jgi:hypothetical protein
MCSPMPTVQAVPTSVSLVQGDCSEVCPLVHEKYQAEFNHLQMNWVLVDDAKGNPRAQLQWVVVDPIGMPASNTYMRSASVAPLSADGRRASSVVAFGCILVVLGAYCLCPSTFAQTSDSRTAKEPTKSWTATTDLKSDALIPERIPVRTIESHSENGNRTLDKRSVEIRGTDGHFEPYQDFERETLTVNASTVKTMMRTFAHDVNGNRALVQVTEEEKHILPGDDSNIVRVTYNPDVNGRLQPVQREIVETKKIGNLEEANTTVMLPSANGGLGPAFKTHELRKRAANDTVETEKTTWLPGVNGKWQLSEIRRNIATQGAKDRSIEERVSRPDAEGRLGQISGVVSQETESTPGEKRTVVETYSIDVPGATRDDSLHLVERKTSTESSSSTGERATEQKVEQIDPGDPGSGLRVSVSVDGKIVPEPSGEQSTVTIRARDSNGSFGIVSVDMTKADQIPTVQIQQTPAEKP